MNATQSLKQQELEALADERRRRLLASNDRERRAAIARACSQSAAMSLDLLKIVNGPDASCDAVAAAEWLERRIVKTFREATGVDLLSAIGFVPRVGEWRRFPWDEYRARWVVSKVDDVAGRQIVTLQREARPYVVDRAEITLETWNQGIAE